MGKKITRKDRNTMAVIEGANQDIRQIRMELEKLQEGLESIVVAELINDIVGLEDHYDNLFNTYIESRGKVSFYTDVEDI